MMEEKTKGLIIKLIDYKDADKLASIFTFEYAVSFVSIVILKLCFFRILSIFLIHPHH